MKRILSLVLAVVLCVVCLAGCGKKDRILFQKGLSKYIDLGAFEGITVDTASAEFDEAYNAVLSADLEAFVTYEDVT